MTLIEKVKTQLEHIHDTVSRYGEIRLSAPCAATCEINGVKYTYNLNKGCVVPNVHLEEIAKICRIWEIVDKMYKSGKTKISDLN